MMDEAIPMNNDEYLQIFAGFSGKKGDLIPLLQVFQKKYGYISEDCVRQIARFLKISENHIFGVTSFYAQFRFRQPAKNSIRVCLGTACHVQGGGQLSREIQNRLRIHPGETSPDKQFDYEEVACLGCCAQASVLEVNGKIYGKMTPDQLDKVLEEHA
jgi:NADH:ubiquinone oxidoreductase subunit E